MLMADRIVMRLVEALIPYARNARTQLSDGKGATTADRLGAVRTAPRLLDGGRDFNWIW
jgi:hypothetical protein